MSGTRDPDCVPLPEGRTIETMLCLAGEEESLASRIMPTSPERICMENMSA